MVVKCEGDSCTSHYGSTGELRKSAGGSGNPLKSCNHSNDDTNENR